jgi:Zn-dependent protease
MTTVPESRLPQDASQSAPLEGAYLPPEHKAAPWKAGGGALVGLGLLASKFKGLWLVLLNLKWFAVGAKVLLSSFSLVASIWFYALFWGWKFALVFVLLIAIHEAGHALFMRFYGVPGSLPYFIPGFGALIAIKGKPASVLHESYIALGGPLLGTAGALCCYVYGLSTLNPFWTAAAYTGFFLNLFNLFPVLPLDGGRVVGSISPRVWIFGFVALFAAAIVFHWWNPLLLVLVILGIPRAVAAWRGTSKDEAYYALTTTQRMGVAAAYFGLCGVLLLAMLVSRVSVSSKHARTMASGYPAHPRRGIRCV